MYKNFFALCVSLVCYRTALKTHVKCGVLMRVYMSVEYNISIQFQLVKRISHQMALGRCIFQKKEKLSIFFVAAKGKYNWKYVRFFTETFHA